MQHIQHTATDYSAGWFSGKTGGVRGGFVRITVYRGGSAMISSIQRTTSAWDIRSGAAPRDNMASVTLESGVRWTASFMLFGNVLAARVTSQDGPFGWMSTPFRGGWGTWASERSHKWSAISQRTENEGEFPDIYIYEDVPTKPLRSPVNFLRISRCGVGPLAGVFFFFVVFDSVLVWVASWAKHSSRWNSSSANSAQRSHEVYSSFQSAFFCWVLGSKDATRRWNSIWKSLLMTWS